MVHRYALLGVLNEEGRPLQHRGVLDQPGQPDPAPGTRPMAGKPCPECGHAAVIHKDACDFCTVCGYVGPCG